MRLLTGAFLACLLVGCGGMSQGCADPNRDTHEVSIGERMDRIEKRQAEMQATLDKVKRGEWERP